MDVWNFILDHGSEFWSSGVTHAQLVGTALLLAVPVAVAVGRARVEPAPVGRRRAGGGRA